MMSEKIPQEILDMKFSNHYSLSAQIEPPHSGNADMAAELALSVFDEYLKSEDFDIFTGITIGVFHPNVTTSARENAIAHYMGTTPVKSEET